MKMNHTRYLSARLHAALTLFDPGSATRRAEAERISKLCLFRSQCGLTMRSDGERCAAANQRAAPCVAVRASNHTLELQPKRNLFYCGYCRVGGGIDKLDEFTARRSSKAGGRTLTDQLGEPCLMRTGDLISNFASACGAAQLQGLK
jgi:hypothetical protein